MKKLFVLVVASLLWLPIFSQTTYYINIVNSDFNNDSCGIINTTIDPPGDWIACGVLVNGVVFQKSVTYSYNVTSDHIFNSTLHIETTCGCVYDFTITDTVLFALLNSHYTRIIFIDGNDCTDYGTIVLGVDELNNLEWRKVMPEARQRDTHSQAKNYKVLWTSCGMKSRPFERLVKRQRLSMTAK